MSSLCFESALPFGVVCELALIGTLIAWFAVDGKKNSCGIVSISQLLEVDTVKAGYLLGK
jgi:hypothetical protein